MRRMSALVAATALGLLLSAGSGFAAENPPVTIEIVGQSSAVIMVNGKPYVAGSALPGRAKVSVTGAATLRVGARAVQVQDKAVFTIHKAAIRVREGQVVVTEPSGQAKTLGRVRRVALNARAAPVRGHGSPSAHISAQVGVPTPPPSPSIQNSVVSPAAPSGP